MYKRIFIVINPASGKNEPILNTINAALKPYDIDWNVGITRKAGDGAAHARNAVAAGYDLVMAYGGDGTQLDVAEGLLGSDVPLGVLPGGTANALAAELHIPNTLSAALQLACSEQTKHHAIDVGKVQDHHYLIRIGTGMIATLQEKVSREMKNRFGLGAYFIAGISALNKPKYVTYTLEIDGQTIQTSGAGCLITNGNAFGVLGLGLSKHVKIDDGLLDVYILNNNLQTVIGLASSIARIEPGSLSLEHWQGRSIRIEADPPQDVYADGENTPFATTPFTTTLLPAALKVLIPSQFE